MKKNLFLDLGNVILKVQKEFTIEKIAKHCKCKTEEIIQSIDWDLEERYESGQISTKDYLHKINEIHPSAEVFTFENLCAMWEYGFAAIESTIELLPELSHKVNLYMLSNTNEIHFTTVEKKFDIAKYFQKLFLSYEMNTRKPNLDIYQKALEMSSSKAEDSFFVDDLPENVLAAQNAGINTHQYKNHQDFYNFLSINSLI